MAVKFEAIGEFDPVVEDWKSYADHLDKRNVPDVNNADKMTVICVTELLWCIYIPTGSKSSCSLTSTI